MVNKLSGGEGLKTIEGTVFSWAGGGVAESFKHSPNYLEYAGDTDPNFLTQDRILREVLPNLPEEPVPRIVWLDGGASLGSRYPLVFELMDVVEDGVGHVSYEFAFPVSPQSDYRTNGLVAIKRTTYYTTSSGREKVFDWKAYGPDGYWVSNSRGQN